MIVVSYIKENRGRKRKRQKMGGEIPPLYMDLEFIQGSELFQEIQSVKDFGLGDCWSGIGGFIGMIVGYSLMNIPQLLSGHLLWFKKKIPFNIDRLF